MRKPIVFLDRDGVINEDSDAFIKSPSEFIFIPGSREAIAMLCDQGFDVIVITNQSMIGRKMVSQKILDAIFEKMKTGVAKAGGKIKDIFFCPHAPDEGCECRKPLPGMVMEARKKYDIDLSASIMVGDSARDIEAGVSAGCGKTVLVRTGKGGTALDVLASKQIQPDHVADDLFAAVQWIIPSFSES